MGLLSEGTVVTEVCTGLLRDRDAELKRVIGNGTGWSRAKESACAVGETSTSGASFPWWQRAGVTL